MKYEKEKDGKGSRGKEGKRMKELEKKINWREGEGERRARRKKEE